MAIAQDMRKIMVMTKAEAIALYFQLAKALNQIRHIDIDAKERKLRIDEAAEAKKAPLQLIYKTLHARLLEWLKMHKALFDKPRKQQVSGVGSFGWENDEAKTDISAATPEEIKEYSDSHDLKLYSVKKVIVPDKAAIAAACADGHVIPGVDYTPKGDNPKISFAKTIDEKQLEG